MLVTCNKKGTEEVVGKDFHKMENVFPRTSSVPLLYSRDVAFLTS